jgi:hypothetical protein
LQELGYVEKLSTFRLMHTLPLIFSCDPQAVTWPIPSFLCLLGN